MAIALGTAGAAHRTRERSGVVRSAPCHARLRARMAQRPSASVAARIALGELRVALGSDRAIADALRIDEASVRRAVLYEDVPRSVLAATLRYLGIDRDALVDRYGREEAAARLPAGALRWFAWPCEPTQKQQAIVSGVLYAGGIEEDLVIHVADELEPALADASAIDWVETLLKTIRERYSDPRRQQKAAARLVQSEQRRLRKLQDRVRERGALTPSVRMESARELVVEADALASDAARGRFSIALARQVERVLRCGQHGRPVRDVRIQCLPEQTTVTFFPCCDAIRDYLRCAVRVALISADP